MVDIVNLRRFKKAAARKDKDVSAGQARAKHGRTKADKDLERARAEKAARDLSGHKRDDD